MQGAALRSRAKRVSSEAVLWARSGYESLMLLCTIVMTIVTVVSFVLDVRALAKKEK